MNKSKLLEYFDASSIKHDIHVIGCGAIGSHLVEQLVRMGVEQIHIWDFDTVAPHNITNQMFIEADIGEEKTDAVQAYAKAINPKVNIITHASGIMPPYTLRGYIFLCVDNIELRNKIVQANRFNPNVIAFFDFRMRLTDAQHYMAERTNEKRMSNLIESMNFTHEEAKEATPRSACGTELSVVYTVKTIVAVGVANFVKLLLEKETHWCILVNLDLMVIDAFK